MSLSERNKGINQLRRTKARRERQRAADEETASLEKIMWRKVCRKKCMRNYLTGKEKKLYKTFCGGEAKGKGEKKGITEERYERKSFYDTKQTCNKLFQGKKKICKKSSVERKKIEGKRRFLEMICKASMMQNKVYD